MKSKNKYGTKFPLTKQPDPDPAEVDTGRNQKSGKARKRKGDQMFEDERETRGKQ